MVVTLGPGRFYGSVLPRPRFHPDGKPFDENRIDPPAPVMDPLIQWAREAHWSMGGLSFNRRRLQGRIEGSVIRLRAQQERQQKNKQEQQRACPSRDFAAGNKKKSREAARDISSESDSETKERGVARKKKVSTFRAQNCSSADREKELAALQKKFLEETKMNRDNRKRRAACMTRDFAGINDSSLSPETAVKRRRVRKLGDEFDRIAVEEGRQQSEDSVRIEEIVAESPEVSPKRRTSPRRNKKGVAESSEIGDAVEVSPKRAWSRTNKKGVAGSSEIGDAADDSPKRSTSPRRNKKGVAENSEIGDAAEAYPKRSTSPRSSKKGAAESSEIGDAAEVTPRRTSPRLKRSRKAFLESPEI